MTFVLKGFNKTEFVNRAKHLISETTSRTLEKNLKVLEDISEKIDATEQVDMSKDAILELRRKIRTFMDNPRRGKDADPFSIRDCRMMCCFASEITERDVSYNDISIIVEMKWGERYLGPLLRFCLYHWNTLDASMYPLYGLFIEKLLHGSVRQPRYAEWKDKVRYFKTVKTDNQDGAVLLGKDLRNEGILPTDFQKKLDLAKDFIHSPYFQKVIRTFYAADTSVPDSLEEVLAEHNNDDTSRIIISDFICKAKNGTLAKQNRLDLQSLALRLVGHPSLAGNWTLFQKDAVLQKGITEARGILTNWLVQDYINEIFRTLIDDPRRKAFWIKYSKFISDVKVVGPSYGKKVLSRIPALKDSLEYCFRVTNSTNEVYAFVMTIGSYKFIEFSVLGNALYVYRQDYEIDRMLNGVYISSAVALKRPSLPSLAYDNSGGSCRMPHASNWESTLSYWMKRHVNI